MASDQARVALRGLSATPLGYGVLPVRTSMYIFVLLSGWLASYVGQSEVPALITSLSFFSLCLLNFISSLFYCFIVLITCNAKRKLNTVPSHPFFHFSNPGRVGVEPHFTDRSRCAFHHLLSLLFLLLYCVRGWGKNIKRKSRVRFQFLGKQGRGVLSDNCAIIFRQTRIVR